MANADPNDETKIALVLDDGSGERPNSDKPSSDVAPSDSTSVEPDGSGFVQPADSKDRSGQTSGLTEGSAGSGERNADTAKSTSSTKVAATVSTTEQAGLSGGKYEILRTIGEGGMGTVFLAQQLSPIKRQVAIKVVRKGPEVERFKRRFINERQALARLDHPNIAKFLDAGQSVGGRPYYVMEYVPGMPITQFCDHYQLDLRDRLSLFTQVCDAVAHAHTKALIHRDIKPTNVLAYMDQETPTAKVIDFGLAKVMQSDGAAMHQTRHGTILGSSYYMSPEQASGSADVDTRSDVYSLGVILYEVLLGVRPHDKSLYPKVNELEFLRIVSTTSALPPSSRLSSLTNADQDTVARRRQVTATQLSKILSKELEWIPLKAMRLERERRYDTPTEMAEDIRRYLAGDALIAAPDSWAYVCRKWFRRNARAVFLSSLAVGLLLSLSVLSSVLYVVGVNRQNELNRQLQEALGKEERAVQAAAEATAGRLVHLKKSLGRGTSVAHPVSKPPQAARAIFTLSELLQWSIRDAENRFASIFIPTSTSSISENSLSLSANLIIPEKINADANVIFSETRGTRTVDAVEIRIFCETASEFRVLVEPSIRMVLKDSFYLSGTENGTTRTFVRGDIEIQFVNPNMTFPKTDRRSDALIVVKRRR